MRRLRQVTDSRETYVDIATRRASQIGELNELRLALPDRIRTAAAGDPVLYGRAVDEAYRAMWRRYCSSGD